MRWGYKYNVVCIPKRRKKWIFGQLRRHLGKVFHELADQRDCQIVESDLTSDPVSECRVQHSTRFMWYKLCKVRHAGRWRFSDCTAP